MSENIMLDTVIKTLDLCFMRISNLENLYKQIAAETNNLPERIAYLEERLSKLNSGQKEEVVEVPQEVTLDTESLLPHKNAFEKVTPKETQKKTASADEILTDMVADWAASRIEDGMITFSKSICESRLGYSIPTPTYIKGLQQGAKRRGFEAPGYGQGKKRAIEILLENPIDISLPIGAFMYKHKIIIQTSSLDVAKKELGEEVSKRPKLEHKPSGQYTIEEQIKAWIINRINKRNPSLYYSDFYRERKLPKTISSKEVFNSIRESVLTDKGYKIINTAVELLAEMQKQKASLPHRLSVLMTVRKVYVNKNVFNSAKEMYMSQ